ncbi:hypothetical protein [Cellulomonas sp. NS3]|uniref:hypothetical protein n=1 Tax=Cellulomonas sp. NS3 TaxID=2973977 RepID=UPI002161135E|nr:hypothetical protein [Cellulomonas sp. NS3]
MTNDYGTAQPADGSQGSTAQAVREEASGVAHSAAESTQHLAQEAKSQAREVAHEAKSQVKDVFGQTRAGLADQASSQQSRVASGIRTFGSDLGSMAESSEGGLAADIARQVAGRTDSVASWLEAREPADLLEEVKTFARRSPGTFLAIAVGAGVLAGRLTRGAKDAAKDTTTGTASYTDTTTPYPATTEYATTGTGYGLTDTAATTTGYETTGGTYGTSTGSYGTTGSTYGTGPVYGTEEVDEGTGAHRAPGAPATGLGGTAAGDPLGGVTVEDGR